MSRNPSASPISQLVGGRLRDLREQHGWSVPELGIAVRAVGGGLSDETLWKLEQGKRQRIGVATVLVLAFVLNVSPLVLLLPEDGQQLVPITPDLTLPAQAIYDWIVGGRPVPSSRQAASSPAAKLQRYQAQAALLKHLPYAVADHQAPRLNVGELNSDGIYRLIKDAQDIAEGDENNGR